MATLYAKKDKTGNVHLYFDEICTKVAGIFPAYSTKPTKRNKYIMYNCHKYRLQWCN